MVSKLVGGISEAYPRGRRQVLVDRHPGVVLHDAGVTANRD